MSQGIPSTLARDYVRKTAKNTTSIEKIGIIAYNGSDTIDC